MAAKISGLAVGEMTAGVILLYSGLSGKSFKDTLRSIITGQAKAPVLGEGTAYSGGVPTGSTGLNIGGGSPGGTTSGGIVSSTAQKYEGHCYNYGGAPGVDGKSCWDCSSFANWVLGHDLSLDIPGYKAGTYDGSVHGPATGSYLIWGGLVKISRAEVGAGDVMLWQTHMGFAIDNQRMISALNPALGTQITGIESGGPGGEILFTLRLRAA